MTNPKISFSRVNRPLNEAASYYSSLSRVYDLLATSEKKFIDLGLDLLDPQQGEFILELGFGTGYAQKFIIQTVRPGLSVGIDISAGMGRTAAKNLSKAGLADQTALAQSDSLPIPMKSSSVDGIFLSFTLELFDTPEIPAVLSECRRVLKSGGRLVLVSLLKDGPLPLLGRIYEKLHDRYPRLLDCRPIPAHQLVEESGFEITQTTKSMMWGLPVVILAARN